MARGGERQSGFDDGHGFIRSVQLIRLGAHGIEVGRDEDTEHDQVTRDFLGARESFFKHLFADSDD